MCQEKRNIVQQLFIIQGIVKATKMGKKAYKKPRLVPRELIRN